MDPQTTDQYGRQLLKLDVLSEGVSLWHLSNYRKDKLLIKPKKSGK